jgi:hypothetical protein
MVEVFGHLRTILMGLFLKLLFQLMAGIAPETKIEDLTIGRVGQEEPMIS